MIKYIILRLFVVIVKHSTNELLVTQIKLKSQKLILIVLFSSYYISKIMRLGTNVLLLKLYVAVMCKYS